MEGAGRHAKTWEVKSGSCVTAPAGVQSGLSRFHYNSVLWFGSQRGELRLKRGYRCFLRLNAGEQSIVLVEDGAEGGDHFRRGGVEDRVVLGGGRGGGGGRGHQIKSRSGWGRLWSFARPQGALIEVVHFASLQTETELPSQSL